MMLVNNTDWDSADLKKLCIRVIRKMGAVGVTKTVYIEYSRRQWYHGRATIGWMNNWIKMFVLKPMQVKHSLGSDGKLEKSLEFIPFDVVCFGNVLEHEVGHNLNLQHKDMGVVDYSRKINYLDGFVVRQKEVKPKPKIDVISLRSARAKDKVKEFQLKLKRTNNLLKKWERKVKYYERRVSR